MNERECTGRRGIREEVLSLWWMLAVVELVVESDYCLLVDTTRFDTAPVAIIANYNRRRPSRVPRSTSLRSAPVRIPPMTVPPRVRASPPTSALAPTPSTAISYRILVIVPSPPRTIPPLSFAFLALPRLLLLGRSHELLARPEGQVDQKIRGSVFAPKSFIHFAHGRQQVAGCQPKELDC